MEPYSKSIIMLNGKSKVFKASRSRKKYGKYMEFVGSIPSMDRLEISSGRVVWIQFGNLISIIKCKRSGQEIYSSMKIIIRDGGTCILNK